MSLISRMTSLFGGPRAVPVGQQVLVDADVLHALIDVALVANSVELLSMYRVNHAFPGAASSHLVRNEDMLALRAELTGLRQVVGGDPEQSMSDALSSLKLLATRGLK